MESKPQNSSANGGNTAPRKNFLMPEFSGDQVLKKREEFAVNLRKKKTKEMIQQKRRKIAQSITKQKNAISGGVSENP